MAPSALGSLIRITISTLRVDDIRLRRTIFRPLARTISSLRSDGNDDLHHLIAPLETQDKEGVRQWLIAAKEARETVRNTLSSQ